MRTVSEALSGSLFISNLFIASSCLIYSMVTGRLHLITSLILSSISLISSSEGSKDKAKSILLFFFSICASIALLQLKRLIIVLFTICSQVCIGAICSLLNFGEGLFIFCSVIIIGSFVSYKNRKMNFVMIEIIRFYQTFLIINHTDYVKFYIVIFFYIFV